MPSFSRMIVRRRSGIERLDQVIGAAAPGLGFEHRIGVAGDHDGRNPLLAADDQLQAIERSEPDIGDQQIGRIVRSRMRRASWKLPVVTTLYPASPSISAKSEPGHTMIIDDENGGHSGRQATSACALHAVYVRNLAVTPRAVFAHRGKARSAFSSRMRPFRRCEPRRSVRPFLKWAGGKRQLLRDLRRFVPPRFSRIPRAVSRQRRAVFRPLAKRPAARNVHAIWGMRTPI